MSPHLHAVTPLFLEAAGKRKQEEEKKSTSLAYMERDVATWDNTDDDAVHRFLEESEINMDLFGERDENMEQSLVGRQLPFVHGC